MSQSLDSARYAFIFVPSLWNYSNFIVITLTAKNFWRDVSRGFAIHPALCFRSDSSLKSVKNYYGGPFVIRTDVWLFAYIVAATKRVVRDWQFGGLGPLGLLDEYLKVKNHITVIIRQGYINGIGFLGEATTNTKNIMESPRKSAREHSNHKSNNEFII